MIGLDQVRVYPQVRVDLRIILLLPGTNDFHDLYFRVNEQALDCLSDRKVLDMSRRRPFFRKIAANLFSNYCGLIYSATKPPSILTAVGFPPAESAVEF